MTPTVTSEQGIVSRAVIAATAKEYNVAQEDVLSSSRNRETAEARHMAMFVLKTYFGFTLEQLGEIFSRSHTAAMYAVNRIADMLDIYKDTKAHFASVMEYLHKTHKIGASATR